jgi:hypothetical protein
MIVIPPPFLPFSGGGGGIIIWSAISDDFLKSLKTVTPAEAGVQNSLNLLDSRFRGNDKKGEIATFYETIISSKSGSCKRRAEWLPFESLWENSWIGLQLFQSL